MQIRNFNKVKKLEKMLKHIWKNCEYPDLIVFSKIQFVLARICIDNEKYRKSNKKLLLGCIENHYGFLVDIILKIVKCGVREEDDTNELLEYYYKAKISIENMTYVQHTSIEDFANETILLFAKVWQTNDTLNECNFLKTFLIENLPINSHAIAEISFLEGNWKKSLEKATIYQKYVLENQCGESYNMLDIYSLKMKCYIALGYKNNVKSCLKQLKKYCKRCPVDPYRETIPIYERLVSNMSEKKSPSNDIPAARTIEKCTYFACEKKKNIFENFYTVQKIGKMATGDDACSAEEKE